MQSKAANNGIRNFNTLLATTTLGLVMIPLTAQAQTQPPAQSEPVEVGEVAIDTTASEYRAEPESPKYTAPLIDTPRSVTVVTEEILQETGATSLADALRTVPGITMAMGEGGAPLADRPFIRGAESTAGILVDGLRDSSSQSRDTFNLEQIEVVRGASGPLAGRGAAGGSLNLVTKTPKAEDFIAGSIGAGNADYLRGTVDVNKALTDNLAVRLNLLGHDSEIAGRDGVYDDRWGIAPSIAWGFNGPTKVTASYSHYESDGIIDYGVPLDTTTGKPVEGINLDNFYGLLNRDFHETELDSGQLEISHDLNDNLRLRNITRVMTSSLAYIASNPDDSQGNVVNGLVYRSPKSTNSTTDTFTNQTDLQAWFDTGSLSHSLSTGIEFTSEETDRATYSVDTTAPGGVSIPRGGCDQFGAGEASGYNCTDLYAPNPNDPWTGTYTLGTPTNTTADTIGAYIFDSITVSDKWVVNLGVRMDDFETETSTDLSNSETIISYQAGVVYKPANNTSVYASFATAATPSGVTIGDGGDNISTTNQDLKPEQNRNYEIGVKWEPGSGDIALNAAIFRNEILDGHVATAAGRGAPQQAIGEQRVDGIELSASGNITSNWGIFSGYSYLNSEIIDAGPVNTDQVGNKMPNTPEHSFTIWTTYDLFEKAQIGGGASYMSERFGNTANTKSVDDYWRFDAMASYDFTDNIAFQLNMNNLFDERYFERVYSTHMATVAAGRTVIASLKFKY
ncbi:TonB-dependent receptor [Hirschia baltica]|uniref:TonB-dependent siderophore receptor n=1 Tax=Hirschia baltica (strain ATCC 49814 / DSM 5838 / IFAM 1418) TaxID=582402 RepID=C6XP25_HIRBI|nr:TonB-dependent siderophore receptor [Hirschia baltica]ACT60205.1 TonB-dependent siderophore receptor [Hirschia baltica ATCC 49814]